MPTSANRLIVTITANIKDYEALAAVVAQMVATVAEKEPGTEQYSFSVDQDNETLFVYEQYVDVAAFVAHGANMGAFAARYFAAVEVTSAAVHMAAGTVLPAELRESLDAFGTKYMHFLGRLESA